MLINHLDNQAPALAHLLAGHFKLMKIAPVSIHRISYSVYRKKLLMSLAKFIWGALVSVMSSPFRPAHIGWARAQTLAFFTAKSVEEVAQHAADSAEATPNSA